ncbi:MAG: gamma-glutamyl-gamma-aminobutyrate hydrolase family protein [Candidatus Sulfotelmatobacter sp.]
MPTNTPRIAIPMPHSTDHEYGERAIPQYESAVKQAGGEPIRIPLDRTAADIKKMIDSCDGVLLPGSNADVDPASFGADRSPHTAAADPRRDAVDALLLEDAYNLRKPVLGICYGLQSLNVYRAGSLIQHIPDFLPEDLRARVNHEAGGKIAVAHAVEIDRDSKLAEIVNGTANGNDREGLGLSKPALSKRSASKGADRDSGSNGASAPAGKLVLPVNSSHHQSADTIGDGLRISARCPDDGIIEALEGSAPDHFVIAVQWHPERSVDQDAPSRAIFRALIQAAKIKAGETQAAGIQAVEARLK